MKIAHPGPARFSGLRNNSPDVHVRAGPMRQQIRLKAASPLQRGSRPGGANRPGRCQANTHPAPANPPEGGGTARFSGLRNNSPDVHVRAGPIVRATPIVRAGRGAWLLLLLILLTACAAPLTQPPQPYAISASGQEIIFFTQNFEILSRASLPLPPDCSIWAHHPPPPNGKSLALQLLCNGRETAWVYHLPSAESRLLRNETITDSRILAWADTNFLYLQTNMLTDPRVLLADARQGRFHPSQLPATVYHLDTRPNAILYAQTDGIGLGSQLWRPGAAAPLLHLPTEIIAFARLSPDTRQVAYIAMPDSTTPFPAGELWLLDMESGTRRPLAPADAGRGFSPLWSPDGRWLAFADSQRNLQILHPESGQTYLCGGEMLHTPVWSPDSQGVFFVIARGDTIETCYCETTSGKISHLPALDGTAWLGYWQP
jgi:hypothetical protein